MSCSHGGALNDNDVLSYSQCHGSFSICNSLNVFKRPVGSL